MHRFLSIVSFMAVLVDSDIGANSGFLSLIAGMIIQYLMLPSFLLIPAAIIASLIRPNTKQITLILLLVLNISLIVNGTGLFFLAAVYPTISWSHLLE